MPKFLFILSLFFLAPTAWGATIKKINTVKKYVVIDEGSDSGFQKKNKVCFYEGTTKLGCGSVRSVKPASAIVRIKSPKTLAKLKEGVEARLELAGIPIAAQAAPEGSEVSDQAPSYIKFFLAGPVVSPVSHANLVYETPQEQTVQSMWSSDSNSRVTSGSIGTEFGLGIGSFTLSFGLRFRPENFYSSKKIASDYDDKDGDAEGYFEQYAETSSGKSSSFGAYLDFYYLNYQWGVASFHLGNGLDYDSSKVNFVMEQKDEFVPDANQILYAADSSLTALFLRTNLLLKFTFGSYGFQVGTTLSLPLSQTQKFSLTTDDDSFSSRLDGLTSEEDLKKSLDHKAAFGADIMGAVHYNF